MKDIFVAQKIAEKTKDKISPKLGIFSNFCHNPKEISFQNQKKNELIVLFLRSHHLTNLPWAALAFVLLFLPFLGLAIASNLKLQFLNTPQAGAFIFIFTWFYFLLIFSYVFICFLHWFYNVFIVTSQRVVDIDYSDIVVHNIAVTDLSHVQDVNYTQSGFISTFFNVGNVFIQTAGDERNFEALNVPKPRRATHIIGDLIGKGESNIG